MVCQSVQDDIIRDAIDAMKMSAGANEHVRNDTEEFARFGLHLKRVFPIISHEDNDENKRCLSNLHSRRHGAPITRLYIATRKSSGVAEPDAPPAVVT